MLETLRLMKESHQGFELKGTRHQDALHVMEEEDIP